MSEWLLVQPARAAPRFTLVCFPYAGGSATIFHEWGRDLPEGVEVQAVRLPGRGTRIREPAMTDMRALVDALAAVVEPEGAYGLFGHSLGARIAFELARELARRGAPPPAHLWLSGSRAPQLPARRPPIHDLPDPALIAELRNYEGGLVDNPELLELYLPILRADFALHDTYTHAHAPPLVTPISVFGGVDDPFITREELEAWREHTRASFDVEMFAGAHLFLHGARQPLLARIGRDLTRALAGS